MLKHYPRIVLRQTTKTVRFFELDIKESLGATDLHYRRVGIIMNQLPNLSVQLETFFSDTNPELEFLFDSLLLSLKTASKHAESTSISRAVPSIKHAQNLSRFLENALLKLPVRSLHEHISDLFEYTQRTLEENCHVPIKEELEELAQLTVELRKGMSSLSKTNYIELHSDTDVDTKRNSSTFH